jgi:hypothetical protein
MAGVALAVEGYEDVLRGLKTADKSIRLGVRKEIRQAAEPVRATAEALAVARISGIDEGDSWSKMRVGVTQTSVYVVPRKRGLKVGSRKRRNLAPLMQARAMEPALFYHQDEVFRHVQSLIDREADRFNRGIPGV